MRNKTDNKLNEIIEAFPATVWEIWLDEEYGKLHRGFVNSHVEKFPGYSREEWLSEANFGLKIIHPDDRIRIEENIVRLSDQGKEYVDEFRWIAKDGSMVWVQSHFSGIYTDDLNYHGIRVVSLDITKNKAAENEIKNRVRQQAAIAELGKKAIEGIKPPNLMNEAVKLAGDVLNCEYVKILELLPDENLFVLRAAAGWQKGLVGNARIGTGDNSEAGYTILLNEPVIVDDMRTETRFKKNALLFDHNVISGMSVVIRGKKHPFGVISVHTTQSRFFNTDDANFLRAIANVIAACIERKKTESELELSVKEKEILLKEIHHRVKNNLQVVSSLLNLQSKSIKDPESVEAFNESQNRIKSMALIHEKLYQSRNFLKISFEEYITDLVKNLFDSYSLGYKSIKPVINVKEIYINIDTAVALGLIINELTSNSLKHAFNSDDYLVNKKGEITISLKQKVGKNYCLQIKDNGCGFPANFDFVNTPTLGLQLVMTLVEQLDGKIELMNEGGAGFSITFSTSR